MTVTESEITWISTGEMISIQGLPNGTYYFQETGETFESDGVTYAIVESKYVFEIQDGELKSVKKSETGETVPSGKETDAKEGYVYSNNDMIYIGDARVPTVSKLTISKSDITGENELSGAKLSITGADGNDKSLGDVKLVQDIPEDSDITNVTNEAEDGTTEIAWTSNGYAVTLEGLPNGKYILTESLLLNLVGKLLCNLVVHVGVYQRTANLFERLGNIYLGDAALTFKDFERPF